LILHLEAPNPALGIRSNQTRPLADSN
jgi:hypothetical protein